MPRQEYEDLRMKLVDAGVDNARATIAATIVDFVGEGADPQNLADIAQACQIIQGVRGLGESNVRRASHSDGKPDVKLVS